MIREDSDSRVIPPSALAMFTDRESYLETFDALVADKDPSAVDVLAFYGEGGIGKTLLSRKLQHRLKEIRGDSLSARLDFGRSESTEPHIAMFRLKEQFSAYAFPTFSIALVAYARKAQQELSFTEGRAFLESLGPFAELFEVALNAPVLSTALGTIRSLSKGKQLLEDWYRKKAEPLLADMDDMDDEDILRRLPALWAADFCDGLKHKWGASDGFFEDDLPEPAPPVIFLDTYEALWRGGPQSEAPTRHVREEWLVDLISWLPQVVWVVTGRDKLKWDEAYGEVWSKRLHQHLVGGLSERDATSFLAKRGITDPAIVDAIVGAACGVPFYLETEAQLHDRMPPDERRPEVFGVAQDEVINRMLAYLDRSEAETMRVLSVLEYWDDTLFSEAVRQFGTGYPERDCAQFGESWSIELRDVGVWEMHRELAVHLQADMRCRRPGLYRDVHEWGFTRFDSLLDSVPQGELATVGVAMFARASSHAWCIKSPQEVSEWFWSRYIAFQQRALWRPLVGVLGDHLKRAEDALGPHDVEVAITLGNLGQLLEKLSHYEDAESALRRGLEIFESSEAASTSQVAVCMHDLGRLMIRGACYDEADRFLSRSLAIMEPTHGSGHPEVGKIMGTLALLRRNQYRYEEAESLYRRSLAAQETANGPDHLDVAVAMNNLGNLLKDLGRYEEAEPLLRRSLNIWETANGPDHPEVAVPLNNLGNLLKDLGRYEEAEPLLRRSLSIRETANGPDHPAVAVALGNLGNLLEDLGRYEEAEPLLRRSLAIMESVHGPNHPLVAKAVNNLAALCTLLSRDGEAETLYLRSLEITEERGDLAPDTATTMANLAALLESQARYGEAESLLQDSLSTLEQVYGPEHHAVARVLNNLAGVLQSLTRNAEAEQRYRRSLEISERVYGPEHLAVANTLNNLAVLLLSLWRFEEAIPLLRRSLAIAEAHLAPENPMVLNTRANLEAAMKALPHDDSGE